MHSRTQPQQNSLHNNIRTGLVALATNAKSGHKMTAHDMTVHLMCTCMIWKLNNCITKQQATKMCVHCITAGSSQDPFTSSLLVHHPPGDSPRSSGSQGTSLLPNSPQPFSPSLSPAKAPVSAGADSSSTAGPPSDAAVGTLPASAASAGAAPRQAPVDPESALSVQAGDGEKQKKGHRRGRSLTGLIPTLKTKPKHSQSQHLEVI